MRSPDAHLHPRPDGVDVRRRLAETNCDPCAHRLRVVGAASTDVAPQRHRLDAVDDDKVEQAVEVEIDDGTAPPPLEADDPRLLSTLDERAVRLAEQEIVGVTHRVVLLGLDVALDDEQVEEPVVVDVPELGVPGRGREHVSAGERAMGGGPTFQGDVLVRRLGRPVGEGLQLVVALTRQVHLRIAVAGDVRAGDAHPPDLQAAPPVGLRVLLRGFAPVDAPQLVGPIEVVVPVVGHSQIALGRTGSSR